MNSSDQDILVSFIKDCNNAYQTIEEKFQNLLIENKNDTLANVTTKLQKELEINKIFPKDKLDLVREELPIINNIRTYDELAKLDGKIVRYFCFVQDILEPEMQIGLLMKTNTRDIKTLDEYLQSNKIRYINYRDSYDPSILDEFDINEDVVLCDRNNVVGMPIPYQNKWFSDSFDTDSNKVIPTREGSGSIISQHLKDFFKTKYAPQGYSEADVNSGPLCLVKFYEAIEGKISMNQIVEITGIFQYQLDNLKDYTHNATGPAEGDNFISIDTLYPLALFPRIHAVELKRLNTPQLLSEKIITKSLEVEGQIESTKVLDELITLLTSITCDKQISELFLISLVSRIYMRKDLETLGNLTLNLTRADQVIKVLTEAGQEAKQYTVAEILYSVIQRLLPFSYLLEVGIQSMNNLSLQPKKDHDLNCLKRSSLQMAGDTLLVLDETKLDVGVLGEKAVKNLQVLNNLIQNQTLIYDFVYYETPLNIDIKTLILSKSKTILKADIQKKLPECERILKEGEHVMNTLFNDEAKWKIYRKYFLECFKNIEKIEISKDLAKAIEGDYVNESKTNKELKPDVLNQRLVVARYLAALEGRTDVDFNLYTRSKEYDA